MSASNPRKAHRNWKEQMRAGQILGLQSGENAATSDAATVRKHLYALLDAPDIAERGLPGCVTTEYKRCGKPRCRCTTGRLHGPYHYWYGRLLGLTWKRYLKRADAPRVLALCQLRRDKHVSRARLRAAMRLLKERWRYLDDILDSGR